MQSAAQDIGPQGRDDQFGSGMVDPFAARTDGVARPAPKGSFLPGLPNPQLPDMKLPQLPDLPTPQLPDLPKPQLPGLPNPQLPDQPGLPGKTIQQVVLGAGGSASRISFGGKVTITGTLGGFGTLSGRDVEILVRPSGAKEFSVASRARTDASGRVAFEASPPAECDFVLRTADGSASSRSVNVKVLASLTLAQARSQETVRLTGRLSPGRSGARIQVEKLEGKSWTLVKSTTTKPDGTYLLEVPTRGGNAILRATTPAAGGLEGGVSNTVTVGP